MTTLAEFFDSVGRVVVGPGSAPVARTVAAETRRRGPNRLAIEAPRSAERTAGRRPWVSFRVRDREASLAVSHPRYLVAFATWLREARDRDPVDAWRRGRRIEPTFHWRRPVYDLYFAQSARAVRHLDREAYVRAMARAGFTHLEVNGLAAPEPLEEGVPGEVYPRFYTYLPALDQFVASFLNRGVYPASWLRANLRRLKENANLAERQGLVPTLTCFEPRSVPDALLARYPELRGCRVDHPFRSFKPRFNLAVGHPLVRRHYRELVQRLLRAVPRLGCLSVWSNDSGAGFEFTRSLYAGANGSAYVVREWSGDDAVARAAAENAVGFLRLLREAAAEVRPGFRVATRLEPFVSEREALLRGMGRGLDVEGPSLLTVGWASRDRHPRYEQDEVSPFTCYSHAFPSDEKPVMKRLAARGCRTHVVHAHGPVNNFEPLLGIPFPWLLREKLEALRAGGVRYVAHLGGIAPPASVPFDVNRDVACRFLFDPLEGAEAAVGEIARAFTGSQEDARTLLGAWRLCERAVGGFDPHPLYFAWGVWYRLQVRPLVPDIGAIPERERAYYERVMLSTHHNPTRVDLARDVLFEVMDATRAQRMAGRIARHALGPLARARARLDGRGSSPALKDLADRLEALSIWMTTRRHVALLVAHVHGHLRARTTRARRAHRAALRAMVRAEIENTEALLGLLDRSEVDFMALSDEAENTFLQGPDFAEHLERKIDLMRRYGDRAPRIDPGIVWRVMSPP
ncbi:MAG: hypothetical protein ACC662_00270 [Planctomycetota bacterium]